MKILISGGHLTPALAFIDYLQKKNKKIELIFVGRKYSSTKNKQLSVENQEVSKRKIKFIEFSAPKTLLLKFSSKNQKYFSISD